MPGESREERPARSRARAGLVAAAVVSIAQVFLFHKVRYDDAYITYRYGQNLALGNGLVFNPGDRLLGTTSPGHAVLAALVHALAGENLLPSAMSALGCLGWTAQAWLTFRLLSRVVPAAEAAFVAGCIALGAAGSALWVPLETNIAAALALGALVMSIESKFAAGAILAGVAGWFRPDAYLVALPCFVLAFRASRTKAAIVLGVTCGLFAAWVLFATAYYGSPLPRSAIVKFQRTGLPEYAWHLLTFVPGRLVPKAWPPFVALPLWALAFAGAARLTRLDRAFAAVPAYAALHFFSYLVLRPPPHQWHLYPQCLVFVILCLVGLGGLVERGTRSLTAGRRAAVAGVLGAAMAITFAVRTVEFAVDHDTNFWWGARDRVYRNVATYLAEHAGSEDLVGAEEVGTIAYYSHLRMADHPGLVFRNPLSLYKRFLRGEPTPLRFLLVNTVERETTRPVYGNRVPAVFRLDGWDLWLFDLQETTPAR